MKMLWLFGYLMDIKSVQSLHCVSHNFWTQAAGVAPVSIHNDQENLKVIREMLVAKKNKHNR